MLRAASLSSGNLLDHLHGLLHHFGTLARAGIGLHRTGMGGIGGALLGADLWVMSLANLTTLYRRPLLSKIGL
jgi:hypothetical protein